MSDVWARVLGTSKDGKFHAHDARRLREVLQGLEGKSVEIAIREERQHRTLSQNDMLHPLARAIAEKSGYTLDEVKVEAVLEALGPETALRHITVNGQAHVIVRGTSSLNKQECSLVMDWMLDKLAFLDVPEPKWDEIEVMP